MRNLIVWAVSMTSVLYGGAKFYLHSEVNDTMDLAVTMMSPFASVEYEGVDSTMTGELTVVGVRVRPHNYRDELYIERLGIDTPSFLSLMEMSDYVTLQGNGIPDSFGLIIDGVRWPVAADFYDELYKLSHELQGIDDDATPAAQCTGKYGFSPDVLTALGYDEQVFSLSMTARNQKGRYSFDVNSSMEDMWDAKARFTLAGDMLSELSKGNQYRPKLREMEIEYTDRSLNARVEKYCRRLGLSPEETLKAQMETFLFYGETNGIEFDEYMIDPYKKFLVEKSSILITAKPNEPVALSQIDLYKPSDVPALLNLEARVQ